MSSGRSDQETATSCSTEIVTKKLLLSSPDIKQNAREEKIFQTEVFVAVALWSEEKLKKKPQKIVVLDVDETLIDFDASTAAEELVFINKEKLQQKIQYAVEHNILLAIATSRYYESPESTHFLCIRNVVKELGAENFAWIFFTNAKHKSHVLHYLWGFHYLFDSNSKFDICHLDDREDVLNECNSKFFLVIKADKNDMNATYLNHLFNFMEGKPVPLFNSPIEMTKPKDEKKDAGHLYEISFSM